KFHARLGRGGATACRKPGTRLMRLGQAARTAEQRTQRLRSSSSRLRRGPWHPVQRASRSWRWCVRPAPVGCWSAGRGPPSPARLRGVDPAPIAAFDGADTLLMLPTWTPRRPAAHLLPSFAPLTDAPLAFRFEVSALADGEWSAWAASATIGAAEFAPLPSATPPLTCDVDVFRAAPAVDAARLRLRVRAAARARRIALVPP